MGTGRGVLRLVLMRGRRLRTSPRGSRVERVLLSSVRGRAWLLVVVAGRLLWRQRPEEAPRYAALRRRGLGRDKYLGCALVRGGGASYNAGLPGAGWSSLAARRAHNPKVAGSNPAPATIWFIFQSADQHVFMQC